MNTNEKQTGSALKALAWEGATKRYGTISPEVAERLKLELDTFARIGAESLLLILKDLVDHAREADIAVGPGRSSTPGSLVCYCIGITDVDPLKFGLLFERFVSPDSTSLPQINLDFGKGRRDKLFRYLRTKYGDDCVALKMNIIELSVLDVIKDLDTEAIPLDDPETLGIFSRGDTDGVFLFEPEGLKKCLRQMETLGFEALVALNALYRPGPMDYIPEFINLANGKVRPKYVLPEEQAILGVTHGVLVYQEQLMVLAERVAGFSPAEADRLRKAVCRRDRSVLEDLHGLFIAGGIAGGHAKESLEAVWNRWTERGQLAFNRSHGVCYTLIGYRMAWMKAHRPEGFGSYLRRIQEDPLLVE